MTSLLDGQSRIRNAEFIKPTNFMRQKLGVGGLEKELIKQADNFLKHHPVDFYPIGTELLKSLNLGVESAKSGGLESEQSIEVILYPAAQLKAHGTMFQYPTVTKIADILVTFLETVDTLNDDVFEIVEAHRTAISYIINTKLKDETCAHSLALQNNLEQACSRYFKYRQPSNRK